MFFTYNDFGWLTGQIPNQVSRSTPLDPGVESYTPVEGEPFPNWTGFSWMLLPYVTPPIPEPEPEPEPVPEDPRIWWIDEGPYKDRFGIDGIAMYASDHRLCRAMVGLIANRKYINLKDPKIRNMMLMIVQAQLPEADPMIPGSGPLTLAKVDAILNTPTNEYERHVKNLDVQTDEAKRDAAEIYKDM